MKLSYVIVALVLLYYVSSSTGAGAVNHPYADWHGTDPSGGAGPPVGTGSLDYYDPGAAGAAPPATVRVPISTFQPPSQHPPAAVAPSFGPAVEAAKGRGHF